MRLNTDRGERPAGGALSEDQEEVMPRKALAALAVKLEALRMMTVGELQKQYRVLCGEKSRSRNKEYLQKKIRWRLQVPIEGGRSNSARNRVQTCLDDHAPSSIRALEPTTEFFAVASASAPERGNERPRGQPRPKARKPRRDPRLPAPGAVLTRLHAGMLHEVTVLEDGFEYRGKREPSLSKIARRITGSAWNGFVFFGLPAGKVTAADEDEANS